MVIPTHFTVYLGTGEASVILILTLLTLLQKRGGTTSTVSPISVEQRIECIGTTRAGQQDVHSLLATPEFYQKRLITDEYR